MPSSSKSHKRKLLGVLGGVPASPPPIWLMRQAGRYLPEYRAVRAQVGGFLELCYAPELACEVTLQPIRRFAFDAAILFADILVVPDALGQGVSFVEGEGPRLEPIRSAPELARLHLGATRPKFARVCETVTKVREALPDETALLGFCGAPWTVATYMVGGEGSADQREARLWAYRDPQGFARLIEILVEASIEYLSMQAEAGADALQIFDTWAGSLASDQFDNWVIEPTLRILQALRARHPNVPVIGFPRGAGDKAAKYAKLTGVQAIGCETAMDISRMSDLARASKVAVQGNLDPIALLAGGAALERSTTALVNGLSGLPHVFNLGHGILPETPPEHVARLVQLVRQP